MSAAELFAGAGSAPGLECWRIETMTPVRNEDGRRGHFCVGDSYIVLHTIPTKSGGFDYNLHFWLGDESSQDERGAAVSTRPPPRTWPRNTRAAPGLTAACVGGALHGAACAPAVAPLWQSVPVSSLSVGPSCESHSRALRPPGPVHLRPGPPPW